MTETDAGLPQDLLESVRRLSDDELVARVRILAARERRETALLVAHLAELDTRQLHLRAGYSSLFVYCRDALALSEHESYNRIEVARAARKFPVALELVAAGAVNLTTVRLLAPHLTAENHLRVLEAARGKRKAEVEEIVVHFAPLPEPPPFIRRLPSAGAAEPTARPRPVGAPLPAAAEDVGAGAEAPSTGPSRWAAPVGRPAAGQVTPLAPERYRFQVTIAGSTLEKLRLAKDMLRHAIPTGDEAKILDRAFDALLAELARAKFAATASPGSPRPAADDSRHVPADVKRAVWLRDLGRCAFVAADGRRCNERAFVEFHHVRPYAVGGAATVENIQLRCRRHNGYEARVFFAGSRRRDDEHVGETAGRYTITATRSAPRARSGTSTAGGRRGLGPGLHRDLPVT